MSVLTPVLLFITLFGALACAWAARRWFGQLRGQQQYTLRGVAIPWVVWPLILLSGLLFIAASLPGLLGNPLWLLDHVFALIRFA